MENQKDNFLLKWIEKSILPIANKIQRNKYLQAIQSAFMTLMPIMLIGGIITIITTPFVDYTKMATTDSMYNFYKGWQLFVNNYGMPLVILRSVTLSSISLWTSLAIAYFLAKHYKMNTIITSVVSLLMFFILCTSVTKDGGLSNDFWGGEGLFAGIIIGIAVTELYRLFTTKKIGTIKMPDMVPPALKSSFASIFPIIFVTVICTIIAMLCNSILRITFPQAILNLFHPLVVTVDNAFGLSLSSILSQICWWFGIHDTAVTSLLEPLMYSNYSANAAAYAKGIAAANLPHIWTEPLWWNWMVIGGSGATLALAVMVLRCKSVQLKTVGKVAIIPALFNINEPLIFGLPIVLNPLFFIPWLLAPTINGLIAYICMAIGIVNKTFIYPGWNIPAPIAQFLSNMDLRSIFLTLVMIIIDGLIYYPFLKVWDKQKLEEERGGENVA
ncbi:PTS Lac IIC [Lactobacillus helsingborgensis]|uniref:Permease IIC component n=1 Tax=Lactobacillus helsingborgensis TaxID=1218494 RepID=A0AA47B2M1_9LACO|nr:PTS transporter subunit EIIC [Lactobacillus helsingborgensis]MCT6888866.1 PTS transporter subunit EIIC [Lactobacillus sp.]KJY64959.1 PTS Lac IIC [Lactobacillus helsingborgensis]MCT6847372.1 PTS transporter subunit EIIC [Lactobacillus helsingborgensis]UZX28964.1 PTS transporter subunit EIIC [Lactobacillus helsingborgensis]UZX30787.1 PTS transporter subunit EIIC [Lactobacillus helsingborgensis]